MTFTVIPNDWPPAATVFVVAGGPSVREVDVERLRGRRVVVVNSSFLRVPFADALFFGDARWFTHNRRDLVAFPGEIWTVASVASDKVRKCRRYDVSIGLSLNRDGVVMGRTSLQATINFVVLRGARKIVLVGADMQAAPDGATHHHAPHPWPQRPGCWDDQMKFMAPMVEPLARLKVEVRNCSPVSRLPWWPKISFEEALQW
ncbi:hypothetical protein [Alsobacter sp. R-9]